MIGTCWVIHRTRNKIPNSKSQSSIKKELVGERGKVCYICSKEVPYIELEHKIPVCVGGSIVDKNNLDLICLNCHRKKTGIDKRIFNLFKKLGLIIDEKVNTVSFIKPEKLIEKYKEFYNILISINDVRESYEGWDDYDTNKLEIEKKMQALHESEQKQEALKDIEYLDNNYSYKVMKRYILENYSENKSLKFFINRNFKVVGKVTNRIEDGIIEFPLIEKVSRVTLDNGLPSKESRLVLFGDKTPKGFEVEDSLNHKFHLYRMVSKVEDHLEVYMILSEKPLDFEEYQIEGMMLQMEDMTEVSKHTKIFKKCHLVFVNEAKSSKKEYKDVDEFMEDIKELDIDEDDFYKNFLSVTLGEKKLYFQHPRYFERLMGAFYLSGRHDSSPYPLHLLIIGNQGGGKSKAMEAIYEHLDEQVPIVEGSGSTMKSLIPSFKGDLTKPGALIESNRLAFVDEFFRILMRVDKEDRQDTLTHLNPLLEHKNRRFGSGNNFLDAKMTSKLLSVTNPVFGTSTMDSLAHKMDNSFLSRIMIWYQDEEHYNEVTSKTEDMLKEIDIKIDSNMWKSIFDYCNSFKAKFDKDKYMEIYSKGKTKIIHLRPESQDIYSSRYKHHLSCLLDGIIKLRCIVEKDKSFEAKECDYENCQEIWFRMLDGWKIGIENTRFQIREGRFTD